RRGCLSYQLFVRSYAYASRRIPPSSNGAPMNCKPSGRSRDVKPQGTESAGKPVILPNAKLRPALTIPMGLDSGRLGASMNGAGARDVGATKAAYLLNKPAA